MAGGNDFATMPMSSNRLWTRSTERESSRSATPTATSSASSSPVAQMDRELTFRRARPSEAGVARELIVRSMAHWDRPPAYLEEARSLMDLAGEDIERDESWVLTDGARIVGFLRVSVSGADAE